MEKNLMLARQIAALDSYDQRELEKKFLELFGFPCGKTVTRTLRRRIICRFQEIYFGELSDSVKAKLEAVADGDAMANLDRKGAKQKNLLKGTRYSRIWRDKLYEVIARGDGSFEFNGEVFRSLSAVAREITGTRWNGKKFFEVRP